MLIMFAVCLCACGKTEEKPQVVLPSVEQNSETDKNAVTDKPQEVQSEQEKDQSKKEDKEAENKEETKSEQEEEPKEEQEVVTGKADEEKTVSDFAEIIHVYEQCQNQRYGIEYDRSQRLEDSFDGVDWYYLVTSPAHSIAGLEEHLMGYLSEEILQEFWDTSCLKESDGNLYYRPGNAGYVSYGVDDAVLLSADKDKFNISISQYGSGDNYIGEYVMVVQNKKGKYRLVDVMEASEFSQISDQGNVVRTDDVTFLGRSVRKWSVDEFVAMLEEAGFNVTVDQEEGFPTYGRAFYNDTNVDIEHQFTATASGENVFSWAFIQREDNDEESLCVGVRDVVLGDSLKQVITKLGLDEEKINQELEVLRLQFDRASSKPDAWRGECNNYKMYLHYFNLDDYMMQIELDEGFFINLDFADGKLNSLVVSLMTLEGRLYYE